MNGEHEDNIEELEDQILEDPTSEVDDDDEDEDSGSDSGDEDDEADDPDEEDGDDEDEEDEEDDEESSGANKRIRKLNEAKKRAEKRVKELEKELEAAKRLSGDDGKAILASAEISGILPKLMSADEAKAFKDMARIPKVVEYYRDWLDDAEDGDELTIGEGQTLTQKEVRKRIRKYEGELAELKEKYGSCHKELLQQVKGIYELGLAATEAGWKPNGSQTPKPGKKKKRTKVEQPTNTVRPKRKAPKLEDMDVDSSDSLEGYIGGMLAKKKKGK